MKRKWLTPVAAMTVAGLLIAGCGTGSGNNTSNTTGSTGQPKDGGTLTVSTFSDIVNADPLFVTDTSSGDVDQFMYASLYDTDAKGNVVADPYSLASDNLQASADGLTYTVKMKTNAKWSDGQPVTADDVIYTINTILDPKSGSQLAPSFDHVKDIKKVDDHTLEIHMKSAYAPFPYSLTVQVVPSHILSKIAVKDLQKSKYGIDPATTVSDGPWNWTEWKQKEYLKFDRNPNYWGPKPHIDSVVYKIYADQNTEVQAMIKGDTDLNEAVPVTQLNAVKANKNITVLLAPGPQYEAVWFNFKSSNFPGGFDPFTGSKTRQAIAYALNRQGMVDSVLKGTGTLMNSPFLPTGWTGADAAATNFGFDPAKAKQLLQEDGWTPGSDGILTKGGHRFSFELQYNTGNSRRQQVAAVIQQNLKDVGIEVNPKGIDFSSWVDQNLNPGKFQAILLGENLTLDPDVSTLFDSKYFPPSGQNMMFYKDATVDKLLEQGLSTLDQNQRKTIYQQAAQAMSADLPQVFLYQYGLPEGLSSKVHYATADAPQAALPYGYFFHMQTWWLQ